MTQFQLDVLDAAKALRRVGLRYQRAMAGTDIAEKLRASTDWDAAFERLKIATDALLAHEDRSVVQ